MAVAGEQLLIACRALRRPIAIDFEARRSGAGEPTPDAHALAPAPQAAIAAENIHLDDRSGASKRVLRPLTWLDIGGADARAGQGAAFCAQQEKKGQEKASHTRLYLKYQTSWPWRRALAS